MRMLLVRPGVRHRMLRVDAEGMGLDVVFIVVRTREKYKVILYYFHAKWYPPLVQPRGSYTHRGPNEVDLYNQHERRAVLHPSP